MVERERIGLLFSVSEGWIGGGYYFLNIIAALNHLPENRKPAIIVYSSDESGFNLAKAIGYPYLSYKSSSFRYSFFERVLNKFGRIVGIGNLIHKGLPSEQMGVLFGYYEQLLSHKCKRKIYWIPDFQEHYYPKFLGEQIAKGRKKLHQELIAKKSEFIFSSYSASNDFDIIYAHHNCKTSVVRFAVTHPDYSKISMEDLQHKYPFSGNYFFSPNQFWPHKNHLVILQAVALLKKAGVLIKFLFSGKINENDSHVLELKKFIAQNDISSQIVFLGFLPREEQLCIMKHSLCVVQPSFFEGWSTVVEDAKAMGKYLVISDIPVHREQTVDCNCLYFDPNDAHILSDRLLHILENKPVDVDYNYERNIQGFADAFMKAVLR